MIQCLKAYLNGDAHSFFWVHQDIDSKVGKEVTATDCPNDWMLLLPILH